MNFGCKCGLYSANDLKFVLHDALDLAGFDTTHARVILFLNSFFFVMDFFYLRLISVISVI